MNCPRCQNSEIEGGQAYCQICGLRLIEKSPQTAATECEEDISLDNQRKIIEKTKVISSDRLSELENVQIALRLYYLIANGDGKSGNDSLEVGRYLECLAYQLINREKRA